MELTEESIKSKRYELEQEIQLLHEECPQGESIFSDTNSVINKKAFLITI